MNTPANHTKCGAYVKAALKALGADVTVSTLPPLVESPYENLGLVCPHGIQFYAEPTGEQIAEWVRDGVA